MAEKTPVLSDVNATKKTKDMLESRGFDLSYGMKEDLLSIAVTIGFQSRDTGSKKLADQVSLHNGRKKK